ncbi:5'/3'-nucleotidase SurE [Candidatus Parvarchaeota archaeon]|nr:5'/3'-nucleotidase SurE [Candidatus Parvarchaeota archaeon]
MILISNDDGLSKGLLLLIEAALENDSDVVAIVPSRQQSATSKKITYHKPLSVRQVDFHGHSVTLIDGTPADAITFAINRRGFLKKKPALAVTGINSGYNVSIHSILSSGTIGAAVEAATYGVPAIAFSAMSNVKNWASGNAWPQPDSTKKWASYFIKEALENGLPEGCDVLNVNFPTNSKKARVEVCRPQMQHFVIKIREEKHKYGLNDYKITGARLAKARRGNDVTRLVKGSVVLTPISISLVEKGAMADIERRHGGKRLGGI